METPKRICWVCGEVEKTSKPLDRYYENNPDFVFCSGDCKTFAIDCKAFARSITVPTKHKLPQNPCSE